MSSISKPITAPEDQSATFVELFFDLVFVYSVTQVVGLLHHEFNWTGVGQAVLVFWLVWWAWSQFTWARERTSGGSLLDRSSATGSTFAV